MDIKGFKTKDGQVHKYDYDALANIPENEDTPDLTEQVERVEAAAKRAEDAEAGAENAAKAAETAKQGAINAQSAAMGAIGHATTQANNAASSASLAGSNATQAKMYADNAEAAATRAEEAVANIPESGGGTVKTVNGVAPDENGNVEISIPDSGGNVDLTEQVNRAETAATEAEKAKQGAINAQSAAMSAYGMAYTQANNAADSATRAEEAATRAEEAAANAGNGSGGVTVATVEPADDDLPMVFLSGDEFSNMTTAKNEVQMVMEYISKTDRFTAPIKIKYQGSSSLSYAKKNFTIKMYENNTYDGKLKKAFRDWGVETNKYVLKANFIDHSHARNIVGANLWSQIVASRPDYDTLPVEMRNSPRNGAVDGFPIKVYVNGTYQGLYTWNIGKDDWMWGMDEDNANHVLMCAETNDNGNKTSTPCNFRALWSGTDGNHWSVEVGTNSTALKTSLNNLIQFVMDNDGDAFRNGIGNYLDVQSAIDYYLYHYTICGHDGLGKNLLLATYDGTKWICGSYDMDGTFGLYQDGKKFLSTEYACPEQYQETNSLLWERIEANYINELKARYAELRASVLSVSNMFATFERFMNRIGSDLYAEDLTIYTSIPLGSTNNITQIRNYIRDRLDYVDGEIAAMRVSVPCTGISLDANTLAFTAEGTQTITATVTPDGCTDTMVWLSSNPSVASISVDGAVCTVTAVANGDSTITVTCGEYSASCSVAVSGITEVEPDEPEEPDADVLYSLPSATTFNGTNYIDTGVKLYDTAKDFTLLAELDLTQQNTTAYAAPIFALEEGSKKPGIYFLYNNGTYYFGGASTNSSGNYVSDALNTIVNRVAITVKQGQLSEVRYATDSTITTRTITAPETFQAFEQTLLLGAYSKNGTVGRYWKGTIYRLDVYNRILTETEIESYFANVTECTGISLDKSSLTFTAEGSQTITATVTPSDCGESIVWESDNSEVAVVADGVVYAVANGSCNIIAKCGEYSASCSVAVSGVAIVDDNPVIDVDVETLTDGATAWNNADGTAAFTLSDSTEVDDYGFLVSSVTQPVSTNAITLSGTFAVEITAKINSIGTEFQFFSLKDTTGTKYCDSVYTNGIYRINGYNGDVNTTLQLTAGQEVAIRLVYAASAVIVYMDNKVIGIYNRPGFGANGSFNVALGWTQYTQNTANARYSVKKFRFWNGAVHPEVT